MRNKKSIKNNKHELFSSLNIFLCEKSSSIYHTWFLLINNFKNVVPISFF